MRTWDVFYPKVLPDVLGCPEPLADEHLRDAARRFCAETRCWREDLDRIRTIAGRASYDLLYPDEADAVTLIGATLEGFDIGLDVPDATTMGERRRGNSGGRRLRTTDLRTLTLLPTPAASGADLRIEALLQPSQAATGVPDAIGDRYLLEIATGALATLLVANKAPWTNPALADLKEKQFRRAIGCVKSAVWRGHSNSRPRVSGQFF
jgi:hypothetical protein